MLLASFSIGKKENFMYTQFTKYQEIDFTTEMPIHSHLNKLTKYFYVSLKNG